MELERNWCTSHFNRCVVWWWQIPWWAMSTKSKMRYNLAGDKTGTLCWSPCPVLAIYIYISRKPYFYWKEGKLKVLPSFSGLMPTKSTEIKVAILSRCCQLFPLENTDLEGTSWPVSSNPPPVSSFPPSSYTGRLCCCGWLWQVNSKWPCAVERCTTLELLEKVASFSVDHHWNGRRHTFCQQLLWIFGRTGALKLQTHVSFTPCWGGSLMCASAVPKMRVSGSSSSLLSASPFFLGAVTTEMLFFIFIGFIGDGLHTAWVCKPGVCSSFCYIFFF